ncbi:proline dehydrogenase family protein [Deferrisoma sp.]
MPDIPDHVDQAIEARVQEFGRLLWDRIQGHVPTLFDTRHWEGRVLDLAMADPEFKTSLFRLVDVLPALQRADQVALHVAEYLGPAAARIPGLPGAAVRAAGNPALAAATARLIRAGVERLGTRFIVGVDAPSAVRRLRRLHREGFAFTADLLGEATVSDAEADTYARRYRDLIETLAREARRWPEHPLLARSPLPRVNVSVKVSSLAPYLDPADPEGGADRVLARLIPLLVRAKEVGVAIHLDLESWDLHDLALEVFERAALDPRLRDWPHLGITLQGYLRCAAEDLERIGRTARERGVPVPVRLVKGAYWETEVIRSRQQGYPCPVFTDKGETDAQFEALATALLQEPDRFLPAFASHNLRSIAWALASADSAGIPRERIEVQTLYGMAEPERAALRDLGCRVRVYCPVGELIPGMAYLVRRLLENTSNEGFLRLTHREGASPEALFAPPGPGPSQGGAQGGNGFHNCGLVDFGRSAERGRFRQAVEEARKALPLIAPVVVGGRERRDGPVLEHPCPARKEGVASRVVTAGPDEVDQAVQIAEEAWPSWRDRPLGERVQLLERLADLLEERRLPLAALEVYEVGKPWREADADVAEAVDHCRYYAHRATEELAPRRMGPVPGEDNLLWYEGVGPAAVIAPWNFPLAILAGMTAAALVAGNPVLIKPAEQSSGVGYAFFRALMEAGFPPEIAQFLPGRGEDVGRRLVADPRVVLIAFTGSMAVGLEILDVAGKTRPEQREVKRVVCEMGGKNAIVVDESADLDAAVAGAIQSAFGYAGQKCSACSRIIAVGSAYDPFRERFVAATQALPLGPPEDPRARIGPVIDAEAHARLSAVIRDPGPGARPLYVGPGRGEGWYVGPAVFEVGDPAHRLMQEELFGPVVALYRARTFDEALDVANRTRYALTGSVYSRTPSHLADARRRFRVGNLYLNRGCTGAVVGRQPFGGFAMSGTGTKAGGPGYLLRFVNPRCASENTVRRGFSPDVQI